MPAAKKAAFDADPAAYREAARLVAGRRADESGRIVRSAPGLGSGAPGDVRGGVRSPATSSRSARPSPTSAPNPEANETVCEFMRGKIRSIVRDPETAEALCPKNHFYGTKRPCIDTNYYETFNLPHVRLVDLRKDPIRTITETGIDTASRSFAFDAIVFATGFDAMTGADRRGRHPGARRAVARRQVGRRSQDLSRA